MKETDDAGKVHKHFVYCKLSTEQAAGMLAKRIDFIKELPIKDYEELTVTEPEVHLTTDGAFVNYCKKRLSRPKLVLLLDTRRELNELLDEFGYEL